MILRYLSWTSVLFYAFEVVILYGYTYVDYSGDAHSSKSTSRNQVNYEEVISVMVIKETKMCYIVNHID